MSELEKDDSVINDNNNNIDNNISNFNQGQKMMNPADVNRLLNGPLTLESTIEMLKLCVRFPDDKEFVQSVVEKTRGSEFLDKAANVVELDRAAVEKFPTVGKEVVQGLLESEEARNEMAAKRLGDDPVLDESMAAYISLVDKDLEDKYVIDRPMFNPRDIMGLSVTKADLLEMGDKYSIMESQRQFGTKTEQKTTEKSAPTIQVETIDIDETILEDNRPSPKKPVLDEQSRKEKEVREVYEDDEPDR